MRWRPKKLLWSLLIFFNFYIWNWTSLGWCQLISWVWYIFFLLWTVYLYITAKPSRLDDSRRLIQIFMRLEYLRLDNFFIFDLHDIRLLMRNLRTWSNRRFAWHYGNFRRFLLLDNITLMWIAAFLVWNWWSLSFRFIQTRTFNKFYMLLLISFYIFNFFSYFLDSVSFLDIWCSNRALCINMTRFSTLFLFLFLSINHFL